MCSKLSAYSFAIGRNNTCWLLPAMVLSQYSFQTNTVEREAGVLTLYEKNTVAAPLLILRWKKNNREIEIFLKIYVLVHLSSKQKWLPNLESVFRMVFRSTVYTEDMKSLLGGETGGRAADRQKHALKGTQGDGLSARGERHSCQNSRN